MADENAATSHGEFNSLPPPKRVKVQAGEAATEGEVKAPAQLAAVAEDETMNTPADGALPVGLPEDEAPMKHFQLGVTGDAASAKVAIEGCADQVLNGKYTLSEAIAHTQEIIHKADGDPIDELIAGAEEAVDQHADQVLKPALDKRGKTIQETDKAFKQLQSSMQKQATAIRDWEAADAKSQTLECLYFAVKSACEVKNVASALHQLDATQRSLEDAQAQVATNAAVATRRQQLVEELLTTFA